MADSEATLSQQRYSGVGIKEILHDYKIARISREMSLHGRKEVLTGRAKFGIFGDGKEIPQLALAKQVRKGDFRSGYYRDQTLMLAVGELTVQQFFAQLYAHPDIKADPHSGGRQMNCHFATRLLDSKGNWRSQTSMINTAADLSPTAGQMTRLLGLAQASKIYREQDGLQNKRDFSIHGNEVAFGTIGDASTSEGLFWETVNAAGVLQVPMVLSIWDDGYGISVPKEHQTTKGSISEVLEGFRRTDQAKGFEIIKVKAWDYPALVEVYEKAVQLARTEHVPVIVHVEEATQPLGHSSSGSHERYKTKERLEWEEEYCCCRKMREWILDEELATEEELDKLAEEAKKEVKEAKDNAQREFQKTIDKSRDELLVILEDLAEERASDRIRQIARELKQVRKPIRKDVVSVARMATREVRGVESETRKRLINWLRLEDDMNRERFNSCLYLESARSPLQVTEELPQYPQYPEMVDGRVVLRDNFAELFESIPELLVFGEDVGRLGDVNLGLEGLQHRFGDVRVADTGIREATILGQGIGLALRGLRPIAEIQYLDYLLYCFQGLSDDLASLHYRTAGGQVAPVIIRTRGHRLEGVWHAGSPMGMIIHGIRGIHVCVPRTLTEAAGMYNTLLRGDDPALVIEPLNAYRLKEPLPSNLGEFTVPLGIPKIVKRGNDITVVSYGPTCTLAESVLPDLEEAGISVELIDVRTLLPFDRNRTILESLKKTNRILFLDEDVPGGATAYMMQRVIDQDEGFYYLDSPARCLCSEEHRTPYATDGDYFCKPSAEDIYEEIYGIMNEADPVKFPSLR
jgi:2-oxoisovalerate dehydrogenase E1 component